MHNVQMLLNDGNRITIPQENIYVLQECNFIFSADGCCRHLTAMLYELESFFVGSCTDEPMRWVKKARPQDEPCVMSEMMLSNKRYLKSLCPIIPTASE